MMINILCITHVDVEGPGVIQTWAGDRKYHFTICKPYKNEILPLIEDFDILIVMGGPQDAYDFIKYPYLKDEVEYIKTAMVLNKKILGLCLGAQLIGEAFGARTIASPEKEIGIYPITLTEKGVNDQLLQGFPLSFPAIHWHGDMPGMLDQFTILASSDGCPRQIIRFDTNIYGFQCHLEITNDGMLKMVQTFLEDLKPGNFIQSKDELLRYDYNLINEMMIQILDRLVEI